MFETIFLNDMRKSFQVDNQEHSVSEKNYTKF